MRSPLIVPIIIPITDGQTIQHMEDIIGSILTDPFRKLSTAILDPELQLKTYADLKMDTL